MMDFEPSPTEMTRERNKARELKKSRWWQNLIQTCCCYYCEAPLKSQDVTMDHIVPISRGGRSTKGNLVPACHTCNVEKRSLTPVEWVEYLERSKQPYPLHLDMK